MLTLTDNAVTLIAHFVRGIDRSANAGIRIRASQAGPPARMSVEFAPAPHLADEVVERNGARVFMDARSAEYLSFKELDAILRNGTVDLMVRSVT
ncbi:Fe-S cluster assembly protein HesB [Microbacterium sp. NPDC019599]|uniref:Fe-S cluster assembly protein HesB n=1 Tax=Microbacterium sp. NPDC019599 TaxID=3154690 RepID=UPI0033EAD214